ncbi:hypothetical protein DPMN_091240 [Dreissena polymorpha]|uniref:Uncharacterized protein n=1 Tax=Dreissena polymorpha TaxID=45954 RepID=A0A9D4KZ74_DREPO|nr:hypothetical protein DPMN_091240 [Dreissena polymorpha]
MLLVTLRYPAKGDFFSEVGETAPERTCTLLEEEEEEGSQQELCVFCVPVYSTGYKCH